MDQENFQVSRARFLLSVFDGSENGPFEVPHGRIKTYDKNKPVPGSPKLYVLQENNSSSVLCSLSSEFHFIGDKIAADNFKDEITPLAKDK